MNVQDAVDLIRPAVSTGGGTWADFGAGTGLFTRALGELAGPSGRVLAVGRDPSALAELHLLADHLATAPGADVVPVNGDFLELASLLNCTGSG